MGSNLPGAKEAFGWAVLGVALSLFQVPAAAKPGIASTQAAPLAVIELFTSEGCSSCPPADKLLADLIKEARGRGKRLAALAFHVDYWNYLGWKDPFSRSKFTRRQRMYSEGKAGRIYTPQMIVNGTTAFVGSDRAAAKRALAAAWNSTPAVSLRLDARPEAGATALRVRFRVFAYTSSDLLNIALAEGDLAVPVEAGENQGRRLHHENVVRAFVSIRLDNADTGSVRLAMPSGMETRNATVIGYVQDDESLAVKGAESTELH